MKWDMRRILFIVVAVACVTLLPASARPVAAQDTGVAAVGATLPPGFALQPLAGGLLFPVDMIFTPTGDILVAEKGSYVTPSDPLASIRLIRNGVLQSEPVITLSVEAERDSGILGIALDPNFSTNGWFYVWYLTGPNAPSAPHDPADRLARLTFNPATGKADPASYTIILDAVQASKYHNGGGLRFLPDGTLLIATGDANKSELAQNTGTANGKLLRIRPTATGYSIPADNPFVGVAGYRPEIYGLGLRNPFRVAVSQATGQAVIAEVGNHTWEEINLVKRGANYGWEFREGPCPSGMVLPCQGAPAWATDPLAYYQHAEGNDSGGAVTGIAYYEGTTFPAEMRGRLFFADYDQGFVGWLRPGGPPAPIQFFASSVGRIVDMEYFRNALFLLDIINGQVLMLTYNGTQNQAPSASMTVNKDFGPAELDVSFSASGSYDVDDPTLRYRWDFGDGSATVETTGPSIMHRYDADGTYQATLRVVDTRGALSSPAQKTITVYSGELPKIELSVVTEPGRAEYYGGDVVNFRATRSNSNGLGPDPYSWGIELHHNQHVHPEVVDLTASGGNYKIPTDNHGGEVDIWYRFNLTMRTASGQKVTVQRDLQPAITSFGVVNLPSGPGYVWLDSEVHPTPLSHEAIPGTVYELTAPLELVLERQVAAFDGWQSPTILATTAPSRTLPITVSVAPMTHTMTFTPVRPAELYQLPVVQR